MEGLSTELGGAAPIASEELRAPFKKYISALNEDVLGRAPTQSALQGWVDQLCSGATLRTAASCLLHSEEHRQKQVRGFYEKILRRTPNEEGLSFWTGLLTSGKSQEEILAAMLSSAEYFKQNGGTDDRYVRALFQDLLGRRSGEIEADAWIGLLSSHSASRLCVAFDFVTSDEYRAHLLKAWHWHYLRREPSADAVHRATEQMKNGIPRDQILMGILSSREYFTRTLGG